jgi:hypothetical protein
MVKWDMFRPSGGTGGVAVYDYGSNQERLLRRVADGGTLWLVTSRRKGDGPTRYHLAYKLVNCAPVEPGQSLFSGRWRHVVRARDWAQSRHFRYNDATDTLRRLEFTSGKPMSEVTNIGLRLLSIPELADADIALLERLQHKIENGRAVFISYSRADSAAASTLESELGERDISTSRDVAFLQPGQEWQAALRREVTGTDCFVVLISPKAAESEWVRKEVRWALSEYDAHGLVKTILPVVLPSGGWEQFPELHRFEHWRYPTAEARKEEFDKLANGIASAPATKAGTLDASSGRAPREPGPAG